MENSPPKPTAPIRHIQLDEKTVLDVDPGVKELPPLYFQNPKDESHVKKVTDPDLAEKLSKQGWTLLDKKPPFVPKEHLTESLRNNPQLQQLRRDLLRETSKPPQKYSTKRPQTKRFNNRKPNSK